MYTPPSSLKTLLMWEYFSFKKLNNWKMEFP